MNDRRETEAERRARIKDIYDRARAVSIEKVLGADYKLRGPDRDKRCPCPLCGSGSKSGTSQFSVNLQKNAWVCHKCGKGGGSIELALELVPEVIGRTTFEAAQWLAGIAPTSGSAARRAPVREAASDRHATADLADRLWREAKPIQLTLVERYLEARGVAPAVIKAAADGLRFHPNAFWGVDDSRMGGQPIRAPAMIARCQAESGPTGGIHVTYLARDGLSKARLMPAKRMFGPHKDAAGRWGGAWLIGPGGTGPLVVGEGIETTLAAASLLGRPCRALSALSLDRLQGKNLRDDDGIEDVWSPKPDPKRPALTWKAPLGAAWPEVIVAVDRDMAPVTVRGRTGRGKIVDFELGPEARAKLCARLAVLAWRRTGVPVRAIAPSPGRDFGDEAVLRGGLK